jgi:uncharacterized protein (DUF3084 family)
MQTSALTAVPENVADDSTRCAKRAKEDIPASTGKGAGSLWLEVGRLREDLEAAQILLATAEKVKVKALAGLTTERDELLAQLSTARAEVAAAVAAKDAAEVTASTASAAEAATAAALGLLRDEVANLANQLQTAKAEGGAMLAELSRVRAAHDVFSGAPSRPPHRVRSDLPG